MTTRHVQVERNLVGNMIAGDDIVVT